MNLSQIRTQARKRLGDATSAFWTNSEMNGYINDGIRDIAFRTKCLRSNGYLTSVSCDVNTSSKKSNEYSLSNNFTNIYSVFEVYFFEGGTDWIRLDPVFRSDLDERSLAWRGNVGRTYIVNAGEPDEVTYYNYNSKTSVPKCYYWNIEEDILGLDPPPNDDNAGADYIRVYYSYKPADISDDSDVPAVPEPLHQAIINFTVATGFEDRGWGDRANDSWNKYFVRLKDYMAERSRGREDDNIISVNYKR